MKRQSRLRIAVQKDGRLYEDSRYLLGLSGVAFNAGKSKLLCHATGMPVDILRVRSHDIPGLIMDGIVDFGITGENSLEEVRLNRRLSGQPCGYRKLMRLGFGKCRLAVAVPEGFAYDGIESLNGCRIATSYPQLLRRFLEDKDVRYELCMLTGSV